MIFFKFIIYHIKSLKRYIDSSITFIRLQAKFPNCMFYPGVIVEQSDFEGYNVLFKDVVISNSSLGAHSYIQKYSTVFNARIGRFCSIATKVSIGPGSHKMDGISTHPAFYLKNTPLLKTYASENHFQPFSEVVIGNDVWIGEGSIIMDGVRIGNGAIIAAGAVVTKDVDHYAIVGGIPAKIIKYRFDELTRKKLLEFKWWDQNEEWIQTNSKSFINSSFFNVE